MTRPRARPVSSFGPELLSALTSGGQKPLEIPFPSYTKAQNFRSRIHQLRSAMRTEDHPMYPVASRVLVRILFGKAAGYTDVPTMKAKNGIHPVNREAPALVIIQPRDSEFTSILKKAGIDTDTGGPTLAPPDLPAEESRPPARTLPPPSTPDDLLLDRILGTKKS